MNSVSASAPLGSDAVAHVDHLFANQQAVALKHPCPTAAERIADLKALRHQIQRYQDVLAQAMSTDFGYRAPAESKMMDELGTVLELNHAIAHLRRWMKPSRRSPELLFLSNSVKVHYQPKGVVGIIVAWNFPIYVALGPLVAALTAGNRAMIKMSEYTPATTTVVRRMLAEIFPETQVAVIGEELLDANHFSSLPFDHIVFTGSPAVGKLVMSSAAQNLTPVTLELGGKSPAFVGRSYPVADAALRITHGKSTNCGQICVSPDYALVPRERVDAFVTAVKDSFTRFYGGQTEHNEHYSSVIHERHYQRELALLDDARAKGARVESCGALPATGSRQLPLHIIRDATPAMRVMQEELFGPILLVVPYDTLEQALAFIHERPRPLALYCFSHDAGERDELLRRTHSGGVTINDWGWHAFNHDAPFGGIGNSGMGSYHGVEGFRELSHARTVFRRHRFFPTALFHPPYGTAVQRLVLRLFLGKADPAVQAEPPTRTEP